MDLRLVTYFLAVVDHKTVTRAAHELYVAQPSLSQAIQALESHMGVRLFDRSGGLSLTADGESFVPVARQILRDVQYAQDKVQAVRDRESGRLDLAVIPSLSVDPLPQLVAEMLESYPGIQLNLLDPGESRAAAAAVRSGSAEIGLTILPIDGAGLDSLRIETQDMAIVVPTSLAGSLPDPVPWPPTQRIPLVVESGSDRLAIASIMPAGGAFVAVECAHRAAIYELVEHGAGAAIMPRRFAEAELGGVVVRSLDPPIRRDIGLIHRAGRLSPAAEAFVKLATRRRIVASEINEGSTRG